MSAGTPPRADADHPAQASTADVYDDGRLRIEYDNFYVACSGQALRLPRAEFLLLARLARNPARLVQAEELWRYTWGASKPYNPDSLHVHIHRLRQRLAPFGIQIETMVNVGYQLLLATRAQSDAHGDSRADLLPQPIEAA